jgi:membrane associated rhomboid family serine protease
MWQFGDMNSWGEIYRSTSLWQCHELALVLEAVDIPYDMTREGEWFVIRVDAERVDAAREELSAYRRENRSLALQRRHPRLAPAKGLIDALPYAGVLVLMDLLRGLHAFHVDWWSAGKSQAQWIVSGQWWRCVTALTLHADLAHLAGNLIFGIVFFMLIRAQTGSGLAWLLILVGGAMGNALNAIVQPPHHSSVGASTAVFAALGILSALAWLNKRQTAGRLLSRISPLIAGVVLLAFLGTGGERTDVMAHLTGFMCGAFLGTLAGLFSYSIPRDTKAQKLYASIALATLIVSWVAALMA